MIQRFTIDYVFRFSQENLNPGEIMYTGDNVSAYCFIDGNRMPTNWELPHDNVGEIEGIEIFSTPHDELGIDVYDVPEYVRLVINDDEIETLNFNSLMSPFHPSGGMSYGTVPFRDKSTCINIGKAILIDGNPLSTSIKVTAGDQVKIVVKNAREARGGALISSDMHVRLHVVTATSYDLGVKFGSFIDQSLPISEKRVPSSVDHWTELHGGRDVQVPFIERRISHGRNVASTTPHSKYVLSRRLRTVDNEWESMDWYLKDGELVQLTHVGILPDESNGAGNAPNIAFCQLPKTPEEVIVIPRSPHSSLSKYPFPLARDLTPMSGGPGELSQPITLYKEDASISIRDNGNSIDAWGVGTKGFMVGSWGYYYKLF